MIIQVADIVTFLLNLSVPKKITIHALPARWPHVNVVCFPNSINKPPFKRFKWNFWELKRHIRLYNTESQIQFDQANPDVSISNQIILLLFNIFFFCLGQGVKATTLGRQNQKNFCYERLALTSIFGLCFMSICLIKSNCYSLIILLCSYNIAQRS